MRVVFVSGCGITMDSETYFLPQPEDGNTISLSQIRELMGNSGSSVNIVFWNADREPYDSPQVFWDENQYSHFRALEEDVDEDIGSSLGMARGLSSDISSSFRRPLPSSFIGFATREGSPTYVDGNCFSRALADAIKRHSNLEIEKMFALVRTQVVAETQSGQSPSAVSELDSNFRYSLALQ